MANNPAPKMSFLDNPHAQDVFADEATGLFFFNGNIRITFESLRCDHTTSPGPLNRVVIGRLVMPLAAAERLKDFLTEYLRKVRVSEEPPGPVTIQ